MVILLLFIPFAPDWYYRLINTVILHYSQRAHLTLLKTRSSEFGIQTRVGWHPYCFWPHLTYFSFAI